MKTSRRLHSVSRQRRRLKKCAHICELVYTIIIGVCDLDLDAADAQSAVSLGRSMRAKIDEYEVLSVTGGQCSQLRFDCIAKHTVVVLLPDVLLSCSYFCCRVVCCCGSASEKMGGYLRERIDVSGKVSPRPCAVPAARAHGALCCSICVVQNTSTNSCSAKSRSPPPSAVWAAVPFANPNPPRQNSKHLKIRATSRAPRPSTCTGGLATCAPQREARVSGTGARSAPTTCVPNAQWSRSRDTR